MPRNNMNGVRQHVLLTGPQHKRLRKMSEKTGLSIAELIRRAVDMLLAEGGA